MELFALRMVAVLVSASVFFTGVHCACAAPAASVPAANHVPHAKSCCSDRSGKQPSSEQVPCDSHDGHRSGCRHCPLVVEAKVRPTDLSVSGPSSAVDFAPLSSTFAPACCDDAATTLNTSGDLPPPRDGRTVLRFHCTLVQ